MIFTKDGTIYNNPEHEHVVIIPEWKPNPDDTENTIPSSSSVLAKDTQLTACAEVCKNMYTKTADTSKGRSPSEKASSCKFVYSAAPGAGPAVGPYSPPGMSMRAT